MQYAQLAYELRARQYAARYVSRAEIDALTDDAMIDAYITCSCCGQRQVSFPQLMQAIDRATNADHFLTLCESFSLKVH
jgi:hypothetical protein